MSKMKTVILRKAENVCEKTKEFLKKKDSGDEKVVVSLLFIVIAVGLVLIFKTQITTLVTNVFGTLTTKINTLLTSFT